MQEQDAAAAENHERARDWVVAVPVTAALAVLGDRDLLDRAERQQAATFVRQEDRERYTAAHLVLREALGASMGRHPAGLAFRREPNGKPVLVDAQGVDVNLSHSGAWIAVGLSRSGRLGIDVEEDRPEAFWREMAASFLSPDEIAATTPPGSAQFLKLWTAKEAALKAEGSGLSIAPDRITVAHRPDGFRVCLPAGTYDGGWLRLDDAHMLAAATDGAPLRLLQCSDQAALRQVLQDLANGGCG